jgi:hypothetical protein
MILQRCIQITFQFVSVSMIKKFDGCAPNPFFIRTPRRTKITIPYSAVCCVNVFVTLNCQKKNNN